MRTVRERKREKDINRRNLQVDMSRDYGATATVYGIRFTLNSSGDDSLYTFVND
jgi:hypothetical protein